ncbi:MAG: 2-oxo-4-hydroxy-4-carboxy-5-ureidoimidazoline decarboxylase [Pseudomarimonas sp.]
MTLDQLNAMEASTFTLTLATIFEHSPWVATGAWPSRPFASVADLHRAMCAVVAGAGVDQQLALIRAHPQLASKAAVRGELTDASNREQGGAGLRDCTPAEFAQLNELNDQYQHRFGFPFILAVRGHTRGSIIEQLQARVGNSPEVEFSAALTQIENIAEFRLRDLFGPPPSGLPTPAV